MKNLFNEYSGPIIAVVVTLAIILIISGIVTPDGIIARQINNMVSNIFHLEGDPNDHDGGGNGGGRVETDIMGNQTQFQLIINNDGTNTLKIIDVSNGQLAP